MDPVLKSQLITSVQRYFLEFLEHFELTADDRGLRAGEKYYMEQAKLMIREKKNTLYVNVAHLAEVRPDLVTFDPTDLQHVIESKYMMVRDALNAAVPELLGKLEDPELQRLVKQAREKDETKFVASFWNMGTHSGIRDLRTDQLGKLVTVCGTVTRTTEMKPELLVGTYQCNVCSREVSGVVQQFKCTWGEGYHGHHWDQHGRGSNGGASWREGHGDRHDWGPAPPWPGSGRGGALHGDDIGEGQERVFGEQRVACLTSDQLVLEDRYKRLSYHLHSVVDEADAGKECDTCCLVVFLHGMGQSEWRLGEHEVRCGIHRRLRAAAPDDWRGNQTMRTLILELSLHSKSPTWVAGWGVTCDGDEEGSWAANSDYDWGFLDVLRDTVKQVQDRYWAVYSVLMGQSLGGQGAMLLGGYCAEMFQAVVVIAGYPVGAISPCPLQDEVQRRMRQYAHDNYMWFLRRFVGHLASGPLFVIVHALSDMKSSFADMAGIAEWASKEAGGQCEFVVVPDSLANSDYGDSGYCRSGHAYINVSLVEGLPSDQVYRQIALGMASVA